MDIWCVFLPIIANRNLSIIVDGLCLKLITKCLKLQQESQVLEEKPGDIFSQPLTNVKLSRENHILASLPLLLEFTAPEVLTLKKKRPCKTYEEVKAIFTVKVKKKHRKSKARTMWGQLRKEELRYQATTYIRPIF